MKLTRNGERFSEMQEEEYDHDSEQETAEVDSMNYFDNDGDDDAEIDEDEELTNNYLNKQLSDRMLYDHELEA